MFKWRCWCWKKILVTTITEYLKKILRYPSQNLYNPPVLLTTSTRKAATNVNGTALHSASNLLLNQD